MIDLGLPFEVSFAGHPPHMSAIDFVLWRRFLARQPLVFERVYYDVGVGGGTLPDSKVSISLQVAWRRLTQQRIDVVGVTPSEWTIIEVRAAAGPGAVGSLLTYRSLWRESAPDDRPVSLWLVTDILPQNLLSVLVEYGIQYFVV